MADREVVRIVTMRSTIHTHTADDCLTLRPLVQPARDRELTNFRKGLVGVDLDRLAALARELVEAEPRTMKQLREALLAEWPDADPQSLAVAARCLLPLVQVTPRGLWGRSGQVALTTAEHWLGRAPPSRTRPRSDDDRAALPRRLRPRLRQGHADLGRSDPAARRLRTAPPAAAHLPGRATAPSSSTSPTRPAPTRTPRPRPASCPSSTTCSSPTPTAPASSPPTSRAAPGRATRPTAPCSSTASSPASGVSRTARSPSSRSASSPGPSGRRWPRRGERMLAALHEGAAYDIRFGTVVREREPERG